MKGLAKRLIAVAAASIMILSSAITVLADSNVTLITRSSVAGAVQVTKTSTSSMSLTVKRTGDTFNVYQIAKIVWSESATTGAVNVSIAWNDAIAAWLPANGFTDAKFTSPESLARSADESAIIEMLRAFKDDETLMQTLAADYLAAAHTDSTDMTAGNSANVTHGTDFTYNITGLGFGLYFVDADNSQRDYQPLMVELMPEQTGPSGNWYMPENGTSASLKYEDIYITKTMNKNTTAMGIASQGAYDVVRAGEITSFEVFVAVPQYLKDSSGNYTYTLYNAIDIMAKGYKLVSSSAKIFFKDKDGNEIHPEAIPTPDIYGNITVSDKDVVYTAILATDAHVYHIAGNEDDIIYGVDTNDNGVEKIKYYGAVNGKLESLGILTNTSANWTVALNAYNTKLAAVGLPTYTGTVEERDYKKSVISIKFDYTKLMTEWIYGEFFTADELATIGKAADEVFVPDTWRTTYDTYINDESYLGTDDNTNVATVYYIEDTTGKINTTSVETKAWTYGAQIIKLDGSTTEDPAGPTYLAGAVFDIYRLDDTYCNTTATNKASVPTASDYSSFVWYSDYEEHASYATSYQAWLGFVVKTLQYHYLLSGVTDAPTIQTAIVTATSANHNYNTLDLFINKYAARANNENYADVILPYASSIKAQYIPVWVGPNECENSSAPHYHMQAYVGFMTDITSEADADGITVSGLDPTTYLLVETKAPDGYNELSEALQFKIDYYTESDYANEGNTYKGFIDDENNKITNGIYTLQVENFTGLTLPSTGGIGTTIFTGMGIAVMFLALILVVMKNRKTKEEY